MATMPTVLKRIRFCTSIIAALTATLSIDRSAAQDLAQYEWESKPWTRWSSAINRDHPLVGKVWSTKANDLINMAQLATQVAEIPFLLFGLERHNPDHYRLLAWLMNERLPAPWRISRRYTSTYLFLSWIAGGSKQGRDIHRFEQSHLNGLRVKMDALIKHANLIDVPIDEFEEKFNQLVLQAKRQESSRAADRLRIAIGWPDNRLLEWTQTEPIIQAVSLNGSVFLDPGGPGIDEVTRYLDYRKNPGDRKHRFRIHRWKRMHLDSPLSNDQLDTLLAHLEAESCRPITSEQLADLLDRHRFSDGYMALELAWRWLPKDRRTDSLSKMKDSDFLIMFVGQNIRIRSDFGIPGHLKKIVGRARVSTVSMVEVHRDKTTINDYVPKASDGSPAVDYLIFTPKQTANRACQ